MKFSFSDLLVQQKEEDLDLFFNTLKEFSRREFVSVGSIQQIMQVSYRRARATLDMLIKRHFASPQIGAYPCRIIKISKLN